MLDQSVLCFPFQINYRRIVNTFFLAQNEGGDAIEEMLSSAWVDNESAQVRTHVPFIVVRRLAG